MEKKIELTGKKLKKYLKLTKKYHEFYANELDVFSYRNELSKVGDFEIGDFIKMERYEKIGYYFIESISIHNLTNGGPERCYQSNIKLYSLNPDDLSYIIVSISYLIEHATKIEVIKKPEIWGKKLDELYYYMRKSDKMKGKIIGFCLDQNKVIIQHKGEYNIIPKWVDPEELHEAPIIKKELFKMDISSVEPNSNDTETPGHWPIYTHSIIQIECSNGTNDEKILEEIRNGIFKHEMDKNAFDEIPGLKKILNKNNIIKIAKESEDLEEILGTLKSDVEDVVCDYYRKNFKRFNTDAVNEAIDWSEISREELEDEPGR